MTAFWASLPFWGRFILILAVLAIGYAFWMTARYNAVKKKVLAMQEVLKPGDIVLTQSGLYGVLTSLENTTAHLRLTNVLRSSLTVFPSKNPLPPRQPERRRPFSNAARDRI